MPQSTQSRKLQCDYKLITFNKDTPLRKQYFNLFTSVTPSGISCCQHCAYKTTSHESHDGDVKQTIQRVSHEDKMHGAGW